MICKNFRSSRFKISTHLVTKIVLAGLMNVDAGRTWPIVGGLSALSSAVGGVME